MPTFKERQDTQWAILDKDQSKLQAIIKINYGSKSNAKVIQRTQVHFMCHR